MKKIIFLFVILFSVDVSAKKIESALLEKVFSDSIICKYMLEYGGIDKDKFVLSHHSGNYCFNKGIVDSGENQGERATLFGYHYKA